MIEPEGGMKKYVNLAMGFIMISVLMNPVLKHIEPMSFEFSFDDEYTKEALEAKSDAYILSFHKKNIEKRAEEILGEGFKAYAEVYSDGQLKSLTVEGVGDVTEKTEELKSEFGCDNIIVKGGADENKY
jgi:hypothetical protein